MNRFNHLLFLLICASSASAAPPALVFLQADLDQPSAIAISEDGRAWVLDGVNGRVVVFSAGGEKVLAFGKPGNGEGELDLPMGIAIAGKHIYVADSGNHRFAVFDMLGRFVRNIPLSGDPLPEPVALSANEDEIFWSDRRHHRVCRYDLEADKASRCWGERGAREGEFQYPLQIAVDRDGYLSVVDVLNGRVQQFHRSGRFVFTTSRFGLEAGELYRPNGLAFAEDGRMLVSDSYRGTVSVFGSGQFQQLLNDAAGEPLRFDSPVGIAVRGNRLYVVEAGADRVSIHGLPAAKKVEPAGIAAASDSRKNCLICHLSWAGDYPAGEGEQDGVPPVATQKMCYSCHHGAVIDSRVSIGRAGQHPDVHNLREQDVAKQNVATKRKDDIPDAFPLLAGKEPEAQRLTCGSCHTPHTTGSEGEILYVKHANPWMRVLNRGGDLCRKCHESRFASTLSKEHPLNGINHPVGIFLKKPPEKGAWGYATSKDLHRGLPQALLEKGAVLGKKQEMICQSCHQIHGGETDKLAVLDHENDELCKSCHGRQHARDKDDARRKGIHPLNIDLTDLDEPLELGGERVEQLTCATCHSMHAGREDSPLLTRKAEDMEQLCAACHPRQHAGDLDEARQKGIHPVNIDLERAVKIRGREIKRVTCLACHSAHAGRPGTPALIEEYRDGRLCSHCHEAESWVVGSDHDLLVTASGQQNRLEELPEQAGVCGSCHSLHRGDGRAPFLYAGEFYPYDGKQAAFERDKLCLDCHRKEGAAEKAIVEYFSHPARDMVLRSDPDKMPLLDDAEEIGEFGAIACITCHDPHRWSSGKVKPGSGHSLLAENQDGNVLNSFLRQWSPEASFCTACHGLETSIKYKYYHKKIARDKGIDYLR